MKKKQLVALLMAATVAGTMAPQTAMAAGVDDGQIDLSGAQEIDLTQAQDTVESILADQATEESAYDENEMVTVIVQVEEASMLERFNESNADELPTFLSENKAQKEAIADQVDAVAEEITGDCAAYTDGQQAEVVYKYDTIMSGLAVKVPFKELSKIKSMKGVKAAFVAHTYDVPVITESTDSLVGTDMVTSREMISTGMVQETEKLDYTGKGMVTAVIDTGLDYNHEAFQTAPEAPHYSSDDIQKIVESNDMACENTFEGTLAATGENGLYKSAKVPFAYDYTDHDVVAIPTQLQNHGTHVSGTVAGNSDKIKGVAPDAQILALKVFGDKGGASDEDILAALQDAVILKADVINMSLGSGAGFSTAETEVMQQVYDSVRLAGINLDVSAGNSTTSDTNNNSDSYADTKNVDNGIVGSPSTYEASLSVASMENEMLNGADCIQVGEDKIGYTDNAGYDQKLKSVFAAGEYQFTDCGKGNPGDFEGKNVEGKVALIQRGDITFSEKVANAHAAGAIGVIVYNNTTGTISMSVDSYVVPAVSITLADGEKLKQLINEDGVGTFKFDPSVTVGVPNSVARQMSDFTSWGTTPDLKIKPEVTAPGGNIYSSYYTLEDGTSVYGLMSGTSMAAPHVTGASAVVKQYVRDAFPELKDALAIENMVNTLMMSTAVPAQDVTNYKADLTGDEPVVYYPVRQQGAGLINLYNAMTTKAYLEVEGSERPKAELGYSEDGTYTYTMSVVNTSDKELTYDLETVAQAEVFDAYADGRYTSLRIDESITDATNITYSGAGVDGKKVTVAPNGKTTITVNIAVDKNNEKIREYSDIYSNGFYVEGFTFVRGTEGNPDLSVPYLGFYGNWGSADMLDGNSYETADTVFGGSYLYNPKATKDANKKYGANIFEKVLNGEAALDGDRIYMSTVSDNKLTDALMPYTVLLRGASELEYDLTDANGKSVLKKTPHNVNKSYYYPALLKLLSAEDFIGNDDLFEFEGKDADGNALADGQYTLTIKATPTKSAKNPEQDVVAQADSISYKINIDNTAPQVVDGSNVFVKNDKVYVAVAVADESRLAGYEVVLKGTDGKERTIAKHIVDGKDTENIFCLGSVKDVEAAGFSADSVKINVYDYAMNESSKEIAIAGNAMVSATKVESAKSTAVGQITVKWDAVDGADGYEISRKDSTGKYKVIATVKGTATSYVDAKVTTGKTYAYKVRAYDEVTLKGKKTKNWGEYSAEKSVMADLPAASKVKSVKNDKDGSMKVTWSKVTGANGYVVYRSTSKNGSYSKLTTVTTTSFTDKKAITLGKTYYYKVRAFVTNGKSDKYGEYSAALSAKAKYVPTTEITSVKKASDTKLKVSWGKVSGAKSYVVYRSTSKNGAYKKIKETTSTSYTDTVVKNKKYFYKVKVVANQGGKKVTSAYSNPVGYVAGK